jgi:hypothetical protein
MSAFVEKKTGFDGSWTLIQSGFRARWRAGSVFAQDMGADFTGAVRESNPRILGVRRGGRFGIYLSNCSSELSTSAPSSVARL